MREPCLATASITTFDDQPSGRVAVLQHHVSPDRRREVLQCRHGYVRLQLRGNEG